MPSARDRAVIEELLEAWFERRHAGERIEIDELCAHVPHLREEFAAAVQRHMALVTPLPAAPSPPPKPPAHAPLQFERCGDFRIKRRIGRGGMGEVFLARQESLDRLVAVKVLNPAFAGDLAYRLRFRREAEIAGALDHPNIVPVYETGEQDGVLYLAMKLIDGEPIDRAAADPAQLAAMGAQVARALHAAHAVGVTHRDVKPANILVAGDHPFLVDFGLARWQADATLTRPGQSPGTLQFMAPEQIRGGPPSIDPRVDVYGLGATLFACLHGSPPFAAEDPQVLLRQILFDDPQRRRVEGRARDLDVVLRRALAKEPQRRFATAVALAEDLENVAAGRPIVSRPIGLLERGAMLARRHPRTALAVALATAITLVLALAVWNVSHEVAVRQAEQLALARDELAQGHPSRARARIGELPADRRSADDARRLAAVVATQLQLEALLDQLQAERRFRDVAFLADLQASVLAGDAAVASSKEAWIAQVLLADFADRPDEIARLLTDPRSRSFPRCSAWCGAAPQAAAAALQAAGDAVNGPDAALDAVAVSTLLRSHEHDPALIAAELARPEYHESSRLGFGKAMMALLEKRDDVAAAILGGILGDGRPHPEVWVSLARIAGRRGHIAAARECLGRAHRDLDAAARTVPFRLVLAEGEIELQHGDLDRCRAAIARARQAWPDRAELLLLESHLAMLDGDLEAALRQSKSAMDHDPLPWTWRRAVTHYLGLRVQAIDMNRPDAGLVAEVVAMATQLRARARAAFDTYHEARAENLLAYVDPDPVRYMAGLERVLELEPGDPTASAQFVEQVFAWFQAGQPLLGELRERATRAVALARANAVRVSREPRCLAPRQLVVSSLCGARLALHLELVDAARELVTAAQRGMPQPSEPMLETELRDIRARLEAGDRTR